MKLHQHLEILFAYLISRDIIKPYHFFQIQWIQCGKTMNMGCTHHQLHCQAAFYTREIFLLVNIEGRTLLRLPEQLFAV